MNAPITEYKPDKSLSPFVELFWKGNFNANPSGNILQRVIPNGYVELIIHLSDLHCDLYNFSGWSQSPVCTVIGVYAQPYEVQFRSLVEVFGIRFKPEGIYNIFGIPASEFAESYEDLSLVLGSDFRSFSDRLREAKTTVGMITLAEKYLQKNIQRNQINLSYVNHAAELIRQTNGIMKIEQLPTKVYISQRQIEREFKDKIGISPKHYLRIMRLNEVHRLLKADRQLNFTEVAYQSGYTDQAHFIKDFKSITGEKPTIFVRERQQFIVNPGTGKD